MLKNHSVASKACFVNCPLHNSNKILYFCGHLDCNVVLCIECKEEHNREHKMKETDPLLLSFPLVVVQVKERLVAAMECLDNLLDEFGSADLLEQNSNGRCMKQNNQGFDEMILEAESLKSKWRDYFCNIGTNEASGIVRACYNYDFQKGICSLKEKVFKSVQTNSLHVINKGQSFSPGLSSTGLGSILKQICGFCAHQSQPGQSGREEEQEISRKAVDAHVRTYTNRPTQLILPSTLTNFEDFSKNPQLDADRSLNISISPVMTIMNDSRTGSPLTGETISAKGKSRCGLLSPYSPYKPRGFVTQIDTFEMIEEEQGEGF